MTGDLHSYNYETDEWVPKANIGLHLGKAAEESRSTGKFLVKTHVYKAKAASGEGVFISKSTETICYLKKVYLQHYLFL